MLKLYTVHSITLFIHATYFSIFTTSYPAQLAHFFGVLLCLIDWRCEFVHNLSGSLVFGFWRHVDMLVDADVSEKHSVSIFHGWSDKTGK
jgi:hypothetical protein